MQKASLLCLEEKLAPPGSTNAMWLEGRQPGRLVIFITEQLTVSSTEWPTVPALLGLQGLQGKGSLGLNQKTPGRAGHPCCSVTQSCLTLCDHVDVDHTPGFPVLPYLLQSYRPVLSTFLVLPYLPEFAQTHVHWVSDAIQPSPFACNLSQHQGLAKLHSFPYSIMEVHCVITLMLFSIVWERCSHFKMKKISPKDVKQFTQSHSQESWDSIPDLYGGSDGHLQLCSGHQTPAKLESRAAPPGSQTPPHGHSRLPRP